MGSIASVTQQEKLIMMMTMMWVIYIKHSKISTWYLLLAKPYFQIDPSDFEPELEVSEAWEESLTEANPTGDDLLMRSYLKTADSNIKNVPSLPSPTSPKPPK